MDPHRVLSPRAKIGRDGLHYIQNFGDFSIAVLNWGRSERVGIRWNGAEEQKGFPTSSGYATWFILPKEVALSYVEKIKGVDLFKRIKATSDEPLR